MAAAGNFPPRSWAFSPWQAEMWNDTLDLDGPQLIVANCGRGAGKDIVMIRCAIRDALKLYARKKADMLGGANVAETNPLVRVWLVAPSDANLEQLHADFTAAMEQVESAMGLEPEALCKWTVRENTFTILGKGQIEFSTRLASFKTRDALRGTGVDLVVYTEFASGRESAYTHELLGTLNRAGRLGRQYLNSTPKGPFGLFYELARDIAGGDEDLLSNTTNGKLVSPDGLSLYYHADSFSNVFLSDRQRARIRAEEKLGWIFDQERLAKFVIADAGGARFFDPAIINKNLFGPDGSKSDGARNVTIGVDLAFSTRGDATAFVVFDLDDGSVVDVEFYETTDSHEIIAHMERLGATWGFPEFYMDATIQQKTIQDFLPKHLRVRPLVIRQNDKERFVNNLKMLFQMGKVRIPDPEHWPGMAPRRRDGLRRLLRELYSFIRVVKQDGRVEYTHPPGGHDDLLFALAYAVDKLARAILLKPEEARDRVSKIF